MYSRVGESLKYWKKDKEILKLQQHRAVTTLKLYGIKRLYALFGVSESVYYPHLRAKQKPKNRGALAFEIKQIFDERRCSVGKRTIKAIRLHW